MNIQSMSSPRFYHCVRLILALVLFVGLTASQEVNWEVMVNGPSDFTCSDIGKGLCTDLQGRIFANGQVSSNDPSGSDLGVICLNPNGSQEWFYTYDSGDFDMGYGIVTDNDGNVYVAASTEPSGSSGFSILSMDPMGEFRWIYTYNPGWDMDFAHAITVGPDGNIYASGNCTLDSWRLHRCCDYQRHAGRCRALGVST